ncbi:hypothetical protein K8R30_03465 [archaeon]|nr:hypothetical protein [archaeon]
MTKKTVREYEEGKFNEISRLDLGGIHKPTIYVASIYGREDRHLFEWGVPGSVGGIDKIKIKVSEYLQKNYDLENNAFAILAFPHVTTFFRRKSMYPQSNLHTSLWNTCDMSPNCGIVKGRNEVSECSIESRVKVVESGLWFPSKNLDDYYSKDRVEIMKKVVDALGGELRLHPVNKFS